MELRQDSLVVSLMTGIPGILLAAITGNLYLPGKKRKESDILVFDQLSACQQPGFSRAMALSEGWKNAVGPR